MLSIATLTGPRTLPLLGNFHQIPAKRLHRTLYKWCKQYGPVYRFKIGARVFLVLGDSAQISEVLRNRPASFRRIRTVESVLEELGCNGLFSAEGANWRRHRALTNPAFNSTHLKQFFTTLQLVTQRLEGHWKQIVDKALEQKVHADLMRFTVDITTTLAFGYDMNSIEKGDDYIHHHLEKIFPLFGRRFLAPFPYWHYLKLPKDRDAERSMEEVQKFLQKIIEQARQKMAADPTLKGHPTCFIEALLAGADDPERPLTDREIIANTLTILLAGEDTTANSIAWMLYYVSKNPEVQKCIQAEVDAVQPQKFEDLEKLKYLEAVALEALRIRPVAPFLFLEANEDFHGATVSIPKGTQVIALISYGGGLEENFSAPERFLPERWLGPREGLNHNPKAFMPFGEGPRFCPGRNLAMLEMKMALAMVGRSFELSQPPDAPEPRDVYKFVAAPEGLQVRLKRRNFT